MTFAFETHVLPLLQEMAEDPLGEFPLQSRVGELDFIETAEASTRYLDLLKSSGYVSFKGQKRGDGTYSFVYEAALTAKALEQLDLWPSDNERGLYLLNRLADAFTAAASQLEDDGDQETANRLHGVGEALKSGIREVGTEVTAKVISNLLTGG